MDPLWLLRGPHEAPGWRDLERGARDGSLDVLHFDRDAWALLRSSACPDGFEGLRPTPPPDGLYVDQSGVRLYVAGGEVVADAAAVLTSLGEEAVQAAQRLGDADLALERLGRAY